MLDAQTIQGMIEQGIPDAQVTVTGEGGKFEAEVISAQFADLSMVKQHQMVYATVNEHIASGVLHALALKTSAP